MKPVLLKEGEGRTEVSLSAHRIGKDLVVFLFNRQGHVGAVALADYSREVQRVSTSVITRLGHKDDPIAYNAAYRLCKHLKKPVCAIAGIHLVGIKPKEIAQVLENCDTLIQRMKSRAAALSTIKNKPRKTRE
jgi:hypothetical protein